METVNYCIKLTANKTSIDGSILGKINDFKDEMLNHENSGLNMYRKNPFLSACDREVKYYDRHSKSEKSAIMFGSNSYLGLTNSKEVIDESLKSLVEFGIGSGGVPLLTGTTIYQNKLERALADLAGFEDSILFSSGYTANLGIISGLVRPNNLVIHDKLNHASLLDGTVLSGAKMLRFKHSDMNDLERILKDNQEAYKDGMLVITDGVFSMDGDIANLPDIIALTRKYNAMLLVDEAHATGVVGPHGAGTLAYYGIKDLSNIMVSGTLSKAIGTVGGYISASQDIIDYLRVYARSNMFSTSLPPNVCAGATKVIEMIQDTDIVEHLTSNAKYLRDKLRKLGFNILNTNTPIIPVIVGDDLIVTKMSKDSLDMGLVINPIFSPAVPPNLSRFRVSVMATHTKADLDFVAKVLVELFDKYKVKRNI